MDDHIKELAMLAGVFCICFAYAVYLLLFNDINQYDRQVAAFDEAYDIDYYELCGEIYVFSQSEDYLEWVTVTIAKEDGYDLDNEGVIGEIAKQDLTNKVLEEKYSDHRLSGLISNVLYALDPSVESEVVSGSVDAILRDIRKCMKGYNILQPSDRNSTVEAILEGLLLAD